MLDLFGQAILDFQTNNTPENIITETSISEPDEMIISYLFREYIEMPKIEQKALNLCFGKVLDVGCGAGSHSLYLQNEKNINVTAIDISPNAVEACKMRGLKNAININLLDLNGEKFDTILLLMNGTGIFKTLKETPKYLETLKSHLNTNGQILIDSSDIIYMFDKNSTGKYIIPNKDKDYYGELDFTISYKNQTASSFPWLYLDFDTLKKISQLSKLNCELIQKGSHYDYLARVTVLDQ
jgi:SAM-dependent methyltransferase